jgi:hypothetical protein
MGHNLLPISGFNFARCLTSHTDKQLLIILSRTEQWKDCTAASGMPFAHMPLQRHGPLYSSDSAHSRGKILVFSRLRQFFALQLGCLMNFCKLKKFLLSPLSKIFQKLWMPLLLLCLGTIRPSVQLPSELPAELLSFPLVWFCHGGMVPPLQPFYDSPFAVLRCGPCSFTICVGSRDKVIIVNRPKACLAADTERFTY